MQEIWKDVSNYVGIYQVSNFGNVRSIRQNQSQQIKPFITNSGYKVVRLYNNNMKRYLVHRLVAQEFIDNPQNLPIVNHKDENKLNNCVDNLEWCTYSYNSNYGHGKGNMIKNKSKKVLQFSLDGKFIAEFPSALEAERKLGISHSDISKCCRGKCKQYRGYIWKFA